MTFVRRDLAAACQLSEAGAAPCPAPTGTGGAAPGPALESFELPALDASAADTARSSEHRMHFVPVWPRARYDMVAAAAASARFRATSLTPAALARSLGVTPVRVPQMIRERSLYAIRIEGACTSRSTRSPNGALCRTSAE